MFQDIYVVQRRKADYVCDQCYQPFTRKDVLKDHVKGSHGEGFACHCGEVFKSRSARDAHRKKGTCVGVESLVI